MDCAVVCQWHFHSISFTQSCVKAIQLCLSVYIRSLAVAWVLSHLKESLQSFLPADTLSFFSLTFSPNITLWNDSDFHVAHLYLFISPHLLTPSFIIFWVSFLGSPGLSFTVMTKSFSVLLRMTPVFFFFTLNRMADSFSPFYSKLFLRADFSSTITLVNSMYVTLCKMFFLLCKRMVKVRIKRALQCFTCVFINIAHSCF